MEGIRKANPLGSFRFSVGLAQRVRVPCRALLRFAGGKGSVENLSLDET